MGPVWEAEGRQRGRHTCRVPRLQYSWTSQVSWALWSPSLRLQALSLIWHSERRSSSKASQGQLAMASPHAHTSPSGMPSTCGRPALSFMA